jgi:hypothetical protein
VEVIWHHKATALGDTLLVLSPEHARAIAEDGWSKKDIQRFLWEQLQKPVKDLLPGKDGGEGLPEHVLAKLERPETDATLIPKFRAPEHLKILVAGGTAGRFSAVIPGWTFPNGSNLVIKKIQIPK